VSIITVTHHRSVRAKDRPIRVIFLDFDGVLNSPATWCNRPLETEAVDRDKVLRLSALVEALDARIVISSSWRYGRTVNDFRGILAKRGLKDPSRIIDLTPPGSSNQHRGSEIRHWLVKQRPLPHFVILDDMDATCFKRLEKHLVQTNGAIGLTDRDCELVIQCMVTQDTQLAKHVCNLCARNCGGCTSPAYQCTWLLTHKHYEEHHGL
jgi:hypothetical protein